MKIDFVKPVSKIEFWKSDVAAFRSFSARPISTSDRRVLSVFEDLLGRDYEEYRFELDPQAPKYLLRLHNDSTPPTSVTIVGSVVLSGERTFFSDSTELWDVLEELFEQLKPRKIQFRGKSCTFD